MKKILAIGGAVIKTARTELIEIIRTHEIEMLIHNGGSLFHDFQLSVDPPPDNQHSYPLTQLLEDYRVNQKTINSINRYFDCPIHDFMPEGSVTRLCHEMNIPVLMFTVLGADFWNMNPDYSQWECYAYFQCESLQTLLQRFRKDNFHYVCMGSAVIHPEIFVKGIAITHPKHFIADVVDFMNMYRPRTRIAVYGDYYQECHQIFLRSWLKEGYPK
jgi:hypothetical protein